LKFLVIQENLQKELVEGLVQEMEKLLVGDKKVKKLELLQLDPVSKVVK
jgi:hypothetical protein